MGTKITFYRDCDDLLIRFFTTEDYFVHCNNIQGLLSEIGLPEYNPDEWSLKCVLLHNGNKFACVPIGHSVIVKEHYLNVKMVLQKLRYSEHNLAICVDFKIINFFARAAREVHQTSLFSLLLGQSRYWSALGKEGLAGTFAVGDKNIINEPLANRDRIVLPPLHIKLDLMKQFVKAIEKECDCFHYIAKTFPGLRIEKLKADIFDRPQIRKLMQDQTFTARMTVAERAAWCSYVSVIREFLGDTKARNYRNLVDVMLQNFQALGEG